MPTWTAPTTRSTGDLISASIWNTDLVENLKYLQDVPEINGLKTTGQVLVGVGTARTLGGLNAILQAETAGSTFSHLSLVTNRNDTGGAGLVLGKSRGTVTGSNTIVQDGDNLGFIRWNAADGVDMDSIAAQILVQVDGTPGSNDTPGRIIFATTADGSASPTERMRIPAAGGVQCVTTLSVGNATPASTGAGITFPASQSASSDANTLDDYEEGTWTPTDGSGAGLTFTQAVGSYTKIGRLVHLVGFVQYPSTANGNTATISGFPFGVANADSAQGHSTIGYSSDDANARYLLPNKNSTNGVIYRNTGLGATNANLSGDSVYFGVTYPVA